MPFACRVYEIGANLQIVFRIEANSAEHMTPFEAISELAGKKRVPETRRALVCTTKIGDPPKGKRATVGSSRACYLVKKRKRCSVKQFVGRLYSKMAKPAIFALEKAEKG
jgi:hypothetical protein